MNPRRSAPTGDLPAALHRWSAWIYGQAVLAHRENPTLKTPEGGPTSWLDHCGMFERDLVVEAIRAGILIPDEPVFLEIFG